MARQASDLVSLGIAFLLGVVLLFGVGFSPGLLHDVTHDLRHALAIPCH